MAKSEAKKKPNENYIHSCNSPLVDISECKCSFSQIGYTDQEFREIICFYVLHDLVSKKDTTVSESKVLKEYGWTEKKNLSKLEREFLRRSNIPSFCFIKAPSMSETLEQMSLSEKNCCVEHPRAVLMQNYKVDVHQSGEVKLHETETRMSCLLRHIRNALAHNQFYLFVNGNIMLEDKDEGEKNITARILIKKETLLDWIRVIKKEDESEGVQEVPKITLEEKTAAEQLEVEIAS